MLKSDKQALRRKILSLSEQISEEARATASQKIAEKVIKFIEQKGFLRVFSTFLIGMKYRHMIIGTITSKR